jgi:hypothetical protein
VLNLVRESQRKGWWSAYDDVLSTNLERYLGYEWGAASIRAWENRFVLGLFQTPDYFRALLRAVNAYMDPDELERVVELRAERQGVLTQPDPVTVWNVIDEAVLRRPVGGPQVMRAQLEHLLALNETSNVTVQIIPFERGGHAGINGPFTIIEFDEPTDPDVVYVDGPAGILFLEKPKDVRRHAGVFNRLLSEALTGDESSELIQAAIDDAAGREGKDPTR